MKLFDYIKDKAFTFCFLGIGMAITAVILLTAGTSIEMISLLGSFFILIVGLWFLTSWYFENRRVRRIVKIAEELPEAYLLGELLPEPYGLLERQYFEVMKTVSLACIERSEQANKEKEEYCEYIESFVHEMKTPLTACSLVLSNDANPDKLKRELKKAVNLTDTILWYARLKSPEKDMHIERLSLKSVVEESVREEMELLIASHISIEIIGAIIVTTERRQFDFILRQLLCNAAKYCPNCNILFDMKENVLRVEDNGIGIPSYDLPRITERGFTGSNTGYSARSSGMGLYLVSKICDGLSITFQTESEIGQYTRFLFTFPHSKKED